MAELKITMTKDRETKGTWRYNEESDSEFFIRNLYLSKVGVQILGNAEELEVIIRPSKIARLADG